MEYTLMTREQFAKLPVSEQRVLVAKDVVALLEARKIKPTLMTYLYMEDLPDRYPYSQPIGGALANVECAACELGAMFLAMVLRTEGHGSQWLHGHHGFTGQAIKDLMAGLWDWYSLTMMEHAFEGWDWANYDCTVKIDFSAFAGALSHSDRMVAISENAIRNNGRFLPMELPGMLAEGEVQIG